MPWSSDLSVNHYFSSQATLQQLEVILCDNLSYDSLMWGWSQWLTLSLGWPLAVTHPDVNVMPPSKQVWSDHSGRWDPCLCCSFLHQEMSTCVVSRLCSHRKCMGITRKVQVVFKVVLGSLEWRRWPWWVRDILLSRWCQAESPHSSGGSHYALTRCHPHHRCVCKGLSFNCDPAGVMCVCREGRAFLRT